MSQDNILKWLSFLFLSIGIFLAVFNIWQPYSYWWDELYSVTASSLPMEEMFSKFVMHDVHPPLYQITLSFWISLFGSSELATRSLSFLFALIALLVFSRWVLKNLPTYLSSVAIVVFSTSFLFSFYAQETRSYSMMLLLATIFTIASLDLIKKKGSVKTAFTVSITGLLLSLTHFFGFIFSGLIILYFFITYKEIKTKLLFLLSGLIILIWPLSHFLLSDLASKTGGSFWIKSEGVQTTLQVFFNALIPQTAIFNKLLSTEVSAYIIATIGSFTIISLIYICIKSRYINSLLNKEHEQHFVFLSIIVFSFILTITLIDLYTPISTTRNFIVFLPVFSIFISYLILNFYRNKTLHLFIVFMFGLSSLYLSYSKLRSKHSPIQNHSVASQFIIDKKLLKTHDFYYRGNSKTGFSDIQKIMATFYIDKSIDIDYKATPLDETELINLDSKKPFIFLSQHKKINTAELMIKLKESGFTASYFEPEQSSKGSVFLIYSKN